MSLSKNITLSRIPPAHHYLFLDCLYVNLFRVLCKSQQSLPHPRISLSTIRACTYGTYSPSFLPTISSVIATSTYCFPLCTAKRSPTKLGRIVAARFCVLIGGVPGGGGSLRGRGSLQAISLVYFFFFLVFWCFKGKRARSEAIDGEQRTGRYSGL